jgi:hypothetical protein
MQVAWKATRAAVATARSPSTGARCAAISAVCGWGWGGSPAAAAAAASERPSAARARVIDE